MHVDPVVIALTIITSFPGWDFLGGREAQGFPIKILPMRAGGEIGENFGYIYSRTKY